MKRQKGILYNLLIFGENTFFMFKLKKKKTDLDEKFVCFMCSFGWLILHCNVYKEVSDRTTATKKNATYLEVLMFFQHLLSIAKWHWHLFWSNLILSVVQPERWIIIIIIIINYYIIIIIIISQLACILLYSLPLSFPVCLINLRWDKCY